MLNVGDKVRTLNSDEQIPVLSPFPGNNYFFSFF